VCYANIKIKEPLFDYWDALDFGSGKSGIPAILCKSVYSKNYSPIYLAIATGAKDVLS